MVITHHKYHVHLHCGMARIKILPPCLSEQRAENLSEDRYLAGKVKVLNFFHMSLWDSLLLLKGRMTDLVRQVKLFKEVSLCVVTVPASHVKDPLIELATINAILLGNIPGSQKRGWFQRHSKWCRNNCRERHLSLLLGDPTVWGLADGVPEGI
jgi:hypothetical protein